MKRFALMALAATFAVPALAADLPVKAPVLNVYDTSGWYVGVEAGAAVAQSKVGSGLFATSLVKGDLTAAGGTVGGCVGYMKGSHLSWWGLQACGDYQNITASNNAAAASVASRWSATQEVRFGGANVMNWISNLTSVLPNLGLTVAFPTFTPPTLTGINLAAAPRTYFALGAYEFGLDGTFGGATGARVGIAPMIKAGAMWQTLDSSGRSNGGAIDVSAMVAFANKGVIVNNAFATGAPSFSGSASLTTQYKATMAYNFAVSH